MLPVPGAAGHNLATLHLANDRSETAPLPPAPQGSSGGAVGAGRAAGLLVAARGHGRGAPWIHCAANRGLPRQAGTAGRSGLGGTGAHRCRDRLFRRSGAQPGAEGCGAAGRPGPACAAAAAGGGSRLGPLPLAQGGGADRRGVSAAGCAAPGRRALGSGGPAAAGRRHAGQQPPGMGAGPARNRHPQRRAALERCPAEHPRTAARRREPGAAQRALAACAAHGRPASPGAGGRCTAGDGQLQGTGAGRQRPPLGTLAGTVVCPGSLAAGAAPALAGRMGSGPGAGTGRLSCLGRCAQRRAGRCHGRPAPAPGAGGLAQRTARAGPAAGGRSAGPAGPGRGLASPGNGLDLHPGRRRPLAGQRCDAALAPGR